MSHPTVDALSDILKTIHLSANTYFCRSFDSPWKMQVRHRPQGLFHIVLEGQCYLREKNNEALLLLNTGDIVSFPTGGTHWISDSPDSQDLSAENVVKVGDEGDFLLLKTGDIVAFPTGGDQWATTCRSQQNTTAQPRKDAGKSDTIDSNNRENTGPHEEITTLMCGTFSYDSSVDHPFLKDLPCFIHISTSGDSQFHWLKNLISLLDIESKVSSPGSTTMVDRLTEILFIQILRSHMEKNDYSKGYMAALADPKIGLTLNLIHSEKDEKWTIDILSKAAALSRTSFTEKFTTLVGVSPKSYLTNTRMLKAKARLQNSNDSMLSIATSAGYSSEAAFSKALKKYFNKTPGQIRGSARKI
ncbi:AraC family transcriptional regulator [Microbulbifer sp. GL-2]|uniref:AraC family transcriptional regulator n=1 Tax=Microbulbifer sp. GL-2 TaxID=2591606 RepID=UPI0011629EFB|nr:AraC family transcriptional regulator [Microbulbifer sp. GL-2]BBM01948.1 transcriptional regulator [Microbulbifer sp. GL-2]